MLSDTEILRAATRSMIIGQTALRIYDAKNDLETLIGLDDGISAERRARITSILEKIESLCEDLCDVSEDYKPDYAVVQEAQRNLIG